MKSTTKRPEAAVAALKSLILVLGILTRAVSAGSLSVLDTDFQPTVTGICQPGLMKIQVNFNQSFVGIVHSRGLNPKSDYRKPPCVVQGNGSNSITLTVDLFTPPDSPDYCGIQVDHKTEERKLNIAVRIHKTLELADDKFYKISCGTTKYKNTRNETSLVALRVLEHDGSKRTQNAYKNQLYKLRVEITPFDELKEDFKVKSCLGFDSENRNISIIDDRGCPTDKGILITNFIYDREHGTADAVMKMFRWSPDQKQLHLQCEVVMCKDGCVEPICDDDDFNSGGNALAIKTGREQDEAAYAHLTTGTSVYILEPGDTPVASASCEDGKRSQWLMYLAIALGVLLLIMFIINVFLCSAMTCSCARTEIIEKDPSIIEDYDPYRSWHGSQYGSRYSLNGKPGYTSGGSTMNSTRSISTNSDHYAIVHSRPGSRYSGPGHKTHHHHHHRGPSSNLGSHYSAK